MRILLTSSGRRSYLVQYFKEVLIDGEIHVANSIETDAMLYADKSIITPLIHDDAYIPFLLNYCSENEIDAIIPLFDVDLPILSMHRKKFNKIGVRVIVSDEQVIQICNDKWETYNFLKSNGFNTPITFLSLSKAFQAIEEQKVSFPLIIKPRWGMGSMLLYEAENKDELKILYEKVKRNIPTTYLKFEAQKNMVESVIIQEKIHGQEYGLDIINDLEGNYQSTIVKRKMAMRAGETDCAQTIINPELFSLGKRLSKSIGHIANLDVDVFINEKGVYILELNPRFGGGYPFSHIAGVNLPKAIVSWLKGNKIKQRELIAKPGIVGYKNLNVIAKSSSLASFLMLNAASFSIV